MARSATDEKTAFQVLSKALGRPVRPAATNKLTPRLEVVRGPLSRMVDGEPGFVLSPACKVLRKALAGGYALRRMQVAGERYGDKPDKNEFSHIADSLQYLLLGGGEAQAMVARTEPGGRRPLMAETGFNLWATDARP